MSAFCALCTSDRGPFVQRPLGKGRALVNVCSRCDGEHPREGRYAFDGMGGGTRTGSTNSGTRRVK